MRVSRNAPRHGAKEGRKTKTQKRYREANSEMLSAEMLLYLSGRDVVRDERKFVSLNAIVLVRPKCLGVSLGALLITFCGLAKGGIFSTNVHTKHKCWTLYKPFYEARNPAFCQTAVSSSGSFFICVN